MSTLCTVLNSSTDKGVMVSSRLGFPLEAVGEDSLLDLVMFQAIRSIHRRLGEEEQMTSYAAVDLTAQLTADTTEQGTAHTAEAPSTRRVVGRGCRSRGWSFRFGTSHQSCACLHRHRIWFLSCLSSRPAGDFILRRHQCLCFSGGSMVPASMVGLRASQFGTASEVPTRELPTHRHILSSRGDILACLLRDGTKPKVHAEGGHRALVVRAMRVGCSVTAILSILRPAILASRPRCCRGGFLHTVVF